MLRFSALLLPVAALTLVIVAAGGRRSRWLATRGGWLVWPLLAAELLLLGWPVIAAVVAAIGAVLAALDRHGRLPSLYGSAPRR